jgi:exopolysaccharide production protein ExoQ
MIRPSRRTAIAGGVSNRQVGAGALVALGALVFSTGPLYRVRSWWNYDDPLAADVAVVAVQSLFGLIGLVALVSGARWRIVDRRLAAMAVLLVVWMVSSALWSADAGTTLRESAMVGVALVAGVGAAVAVSERTLVLAGWVGVQAGLAWSALGIVTLQPGTQDTKGWTGVYFNPNSLALLAAVGVLLSVVLAAQHWRSRGRWPIVAVLAVAVAADLWLIRGTESLTPLAALLFALAAAALASLGRRFAGPGRRAERHAARITALVGAGVIAVTVVAFVSRNSWLESFGRSSTLTGRTEIWEVAFDWWKDRPLRGYGYLGAWADPQFAMDQLEVRGEVLGSSHNSFIELLLGTGVVGFALAVVLTASLWTAAGHRALTGRMAAASWPLAVLVFVIVENLAETLWVGGQLVVVLVGVLIVASKAHDAPERSPDALADLGDDSAGRHAFSEPDDGAARSTSSIALDDRVADDRVAEVVRGDRHD